MTLLPGVVPVLLLLTSIKFEPQLPWLLHTPDFSVTSKNLLGILIHRYSVGKGWSMRLPNLNDL